MMVDTHETEVANFQLPAVLGAKVIVELEYIPRVSGRY